jgi:hypothetical protein
MLRRLRCARDWVAGRWAYLPLSRKRKSAQAHAAALILVACSLMSASLAVVLAHPEVQDARSVPLTPTVALTQTVGDAGSALFTDATLAGTAQSFDRVYGIPTANGREVSVGGVTVDLVIDFTTGVDGLLRAKAIHLNQPPSGPESVSWSRSAGESFIQQVSPRDATTTAYGAAHDGSVIHVMHSSRVAALLGTTGTFEWYCERAHARSGVDHCLISIVTM